MTTRANTIPLIPPAARRRRSLRFAIVLVTLCTALGACTDSATLVEEDSEQRMAVAFTAVAVSPTQINLSWPMHPASDIAGYRVFRDGAPIAVVGATAFSDRGLTPSTTYSYRYSAYDIAGNESVQSAPVTATTLADSSPRSFANDIFPILQTCVGCHSDYASPQTAYLSVTGRGIGVCGGRATTVAGSAARSLLYQKVTSSHDCGVLMPPSGRLNSEQASTIGTWINQGAANN